MSLSLSRQALVTTGSDEFHCRHCLLLQLADGADENFGFSDNAKTEPMRRDRPGVCVRLRCTLERSTRANRTEQSKTKRPRVRSMGVDRRTFGTA
eukprot:COSAG06_NODE_2370_length_6994_cov_52.779405_2_plen_95_part_00